MPIKEQIKKELSEELLMFQLKERYESMHLLRDRIQAICLRILWILLWISWWLAQWKLEFSCCEKCAAIILLIVCVLLFYFYFENLKTGRLSQHNLAIQLEQRLGLYKWTLPDKFGENKSRPFLKHHYCLLLFWVIVLFICILYFT